MDEKLERALQGGVPQGKALYAEKTSNIGYYVSEWHDATAG